MKRHFKVALVVFAVLVVILGIALLGAKTYVESIGTRNHIEARLSKVLGLPLVIGAIELSPTRGLVLENVSSPGEEGNFLEGATFRAKCRLLPLLRQRLEIYGLRAENPKIVWRQGADGKWALPTLPKTESEEPAAEPKPASPAKEPAKKSEGLQVKVDGLKLVGASVEFVNKDKESAVKLTGVNIDYDVITPEKMSGQVRIDRVQCSALAISGIQSPFQYAGGTVTLEPLSGALAGGALSGAFRLESAGQGIPFDAKLKLTGADIGKMMNETGWAPNQFFGRVDGSVEMRGTVRRLVKVEGKGGLALTGAQIKGFEFFTTIAEGLRIPELADLRLGDSAVEFRLGDEKVFIDSLALNSPAVKVLANGLVRLNGRITVDARLALAESTIQQLPDFAREFVAKVNGESGIDFKVGGTMSKPKTDLMDKVSGKRALGQAVDVVGNLFGDKKKKDEQKKEKEKKPAGDSSKSTPPPLPAVDPTATLVVPPAEPPVAPAPPAPVPPAPAPESAPESAPAPPPPAPQP